MAAMQLGSQPAAGFRAELYAEELRTANPKILWDTRVYCPRARAQRARALDRRVQHAHGRARATRVTHVHRKHGR